MRCEFTQVEVAGRMGLSRSDLSKLERRRDLRLSTLRSYAQALGGGIRILFVPDDGTAAIRLDGTGGKVDPTGGEVQYLPAFSWRDRTNSPSARATALPWAKSPRESRYHATAAGKVPSDDSAFPRISHTRPEPAGEVVRT